MDSTSGIRGRTNQVKKVVLNPLSLIVERGRKRAVDASVLRWLAAQTLVGVQREQLKMSKSGTSDRIEGPRSDSQGGLQLTSQRMIIKSTHINYYVGSVYSQAYKPGQMYAKNQKFNTLNVKAGIPYLVLVGKKHERNVKNLPV